MVRPTSPQSPAKRWRPSTTAARSLRSRRGIRASRSTTPTTSPPRCEPRASRAANACWAARSASPTAPSGPSTASMPRCGAICMTARCAISPISACPGKWVPVSERTCQTKYGTFPLAGLAEPRIEPEIVFGLSRAPAQDMDDATLIGCVEWVAHGFELVQSIFPGLEILAGRHGRRERPAWRAADRAAPSGRRTSRGMAAHPHRRSTSISSATAHRWTAAAPAT